MPSPSPEPPAGNTRDEAVAAARAQYGPDVRIRGVRRIRSGGVAGFFSQERFIADVVLPEGGEDASRAATKAGAKAAPKAVAKPAAKGRPAVAPARAATPTVVAEVPPAGLSQAETLSAWPSSGLSVDDLLEVALQVRDAQRSADETPTGVLPAVDPVDELADLLGAAGDEPVGTYSPTSLARPAATRREAPRPVAAATSVPARAPIATRREPEPPAPAAPAWERTSRSVPPTPAPLHDEPADVDVAVVAVGADDTEDAGAPPSPFAAALMRVVTQDDEVQAAVAGAEQQHQEDDAPVAAQHDDQPPATEPDAPRGRAAAVRAAALRAEAEAVAAARAGVAQASDSATLAVIAAAAPVAALPAAPTTPSAAPTRSPEERRAAARARAEARRAARDTRPTGDRTAVAEPVDAVVEPAIAEPVVAEPVIAAAVVVEPVGVVPLVVEPLVAAPVGAGPVVAELVPTTGDHPVWDATSIIELAPRAGRPAAAVRPPAPSATRTPRPAPVAAAAPTPTAAPTAAPIAPQTRVTSARAGAAALREAAIRAAGELAERQVSGVGSAPDLLDEFVDAELAGTAAPATAPARSPLADRAARLRSVLAAATPPAELPAAAAAAADAETDAEVGAVLDAVEPPVRRRLPAAPPAAPAAAAVTVVAERHPDAADAAAAEAQAQAQAQAAAEAAQVEAARIEAERIEAERLQAARTEAARIAAEQADARRAAAEAAQVEATRIEAERIAAEARRMAADAARVEAQRVEAQRVEAQRVEAQKIEAERVEAQRVEAERAAETARIEAARLAAERADAQRVAAEQAAARAAAEAERVAAERIAAEIARAEAARIEAARIEAARIEAARIEAEVAAVELAEVAALPSEGTDDGVRHRTRAERRAAAEVARSRPVVVTTLPGTAEHTTPDAAQLAGPVAVPTLDVPTLDVPALDVPAVDPLWGTPVRRPVEVLDSGRHRGATGRRRAADDDSPVAVPSTDVASAAPVEPVVGVVLDAPRSYTAGSRYDEILFGTPRSSTRATTTTPDPLEALRAAALAGGVTAPRRRRAAEAAGRHRTLPTQIDVPAVGAARLTALDDPSEATSGFIEVLQAVADSDFVAESAAAPQLAPEVSDVLVQEMAHEMAAGMAEELARTASDPAPVVADGSSMLSAPEGLVGSAPRVRGHRPPVPVSASASRSRSLPPHPSTRMRGVRGTDDSDGWATITHLVPVADDPAPAEGAAGLAALGVPASVLGADFAAEAGRRGTFAALASALGRALPSAPALPSEPGDVLVVVGPGAEALTAARALAVALRLDPARVLWCTRGPLAGLASADVQVSGVAVAAERRAAAGAADVPTVVAVDVPLGDAGGAWAAQMVQAWAGTAVWGVLDSTRKPGALRTWLAELPRVDAVVVTDTDSAPDPAALLDGLPVPVAVVDGARATPHRWAALLCERLAGRR